MNRRVLYIVPIIRLLDKAQGPLDTSTIARLTSMSWPTANKYLNLIKESNTLGLIKIEKSRAYWRMKKEPRLEDIEELLQTT